MKPDAGALVTQLELAGLLGVDRNTVAAWTRSGMPVARRGRGSRGHAYAVGPCVRWTRQRDHEQHTRALAAAKAVSPAERARVRKLTADARRVELATLEREGDVVRTDEVRAESFRVARLVRDNMLNITPRLEQSLAAETDPAKIRTMLDSEIRQALEVTADIIAAGGDATTPPTPRKDDEP